VSVHGRALELLLAEDEPTRLRGVHLLRDEGADAAAAELLTGALADRGSYVPHAARAALTTLADTALPALFSALDDDAVRVHALWALAAPQGDSAVAVAGHVAACSGDADRTVRHAVAGVLGRLDAGADVVDQTLRDLALDRDHRVRTEAVESMALTAREHFREDLLDALEDGHPAVRAAAATGLTGTPSDAAALSRARTAFADETREPARLALAGLLERWETA
jgi:HEAT repeat protein